MAVTSGNLSVSGIATIGEKLTVTTGGAEIVSGNMAVTSGNLSVSASASVGGNLAVTGKITCDSIQIGGNGASDAGQLSIALDASFGSRVYIHDNVYMDADNKLSIGSLFFSTMETAEPNTIGTTAGNLVIHPADSVNDWTVIKSNLKVDGKVNFTGDFIRTDTIVNVTEQFDISNSGTGPALKVTQWDQQSDVASFRYDSSPILLISANNKVGINIPLSNNINYHLDVSGNAHVSSTMKVDGKLTLMNDLEITGHYLSAAGNITLTDGKLTTKTMQVTTTSDFDGLATFKSGIRLMNGSQVTYFDQSDAAW
jgi:cytoskeletal protein CcmA (bactofilin family)